MSTSLLYHGFGATTYSYHRTEYHQGGMTFHLKKKPKYQRCVICKSRNVIRQGQRFLKVRTLPIGPKPIFLGLHLHRLKCRDCKSYRQESRDLTLPRKSYTKQLARFVLDLAEKMTLTDISQHLHLNWQIVKDIVKSDLEKKEKARSWKNVSLIAVDEIAIRKGHRYMTVIADLETGMVLDVVDGRDSDCLKPVFHRLIRVGAPFKAVAMDMSPAYRKAVAEYARPSTKIVHDPFHIVQAMNKMVDEVRRDEHARLIEEGHEAIKGNRFLLLFAREKLMSDPDKANRLNTMLKLNENLNKAYLLKEDFRQFWSQGNKYNAAQFLDTWLAQARSLKLGPVQRIAKTIGKCRDSILSWYDHRISNGPLEGLNNKIKVLKRRAYGYRDTAFFRLLILFLHDKPFRLAGT